MKKWFNQKERSAGAFRLLILWWIYKFLGKSFLNFVVFFVALISFIFASEIRKYQRKYFKVYSEFYSKELKASLKNLFKHYLSYAYSLADRIEIFSGNLNHKKIIFANENDKIQLKNDFSKEKGIFFICNHLGNVDAMRAFITSDIGHKNLKVNVFMQKNQTQIFNNFIDAIAIKTPICTYPVEEIGARAFEGVNNIVYLTVPINVVTIGEYAFRHMKGLEEIYFTTNILPPAHVFDGVNEGLVIYAPIGESLRGYCNTFDYNYIEWNPAECFDWEYVDATRTEIIVNAFNPNHSNCLGSHTDIVIPMYINGVKVTQIGDRAFTEGNEAIISVNIPTSIQSIGAYAFEGCSSLEYVFIPL